MIDAARAFDRILAQLALGPRFVGSPGHRAAHGLLAEWLAGADRLREDVFEERFFGAAVTCRNLWARFAGERPGRVLLGSHFDTRPWADRDANPARRREPVPGANDGASGIAVLAELAGALGERRARPTVDLVFFDAEDWHDIDGKHVSLGAEHFVAKLDPDERPDAVIIVDMVAGRDLVLDVDANCLGHEPSYALTRDVFRIGQTLSLAAFSLDKPEPYKWVWCDHIPFVQAGIPSCLLIDLDYAPWHTVSDLPDACSAASLEQVGRLLEKYLFY